MRAAALAIALAALAWRALPGQVPRQRVDTVRLRSDTLGQRGDTTRRRDTTSVGRGLGIPSQPSRQFPAADSVITELLARRGFRVTRYAADSVQLLADTKEIRLAGKGLIERESSTLEADTVRYVEDRCALYAAGQPRLFDRTGVLIGEGMQYDACNHAGIVQRATTDFQQGGGTWFVRGDIAVDNLEDRSYVHGGTITSCDLVDPHYHFAARQVKVVTKRLMVSRPAVLYVADVPVMWLPFVFQDMRHGRRSGILPPQFGINDIVRVNPSYQRHVANIGYYWAFSDYTDAQVSLDWYAQRSTAINGRFRYRVLDRFFAGGISFTELHQSGGGSSRRISWSHDQAFSQSSHLSASVDYATSASVISRNAVDPILAVGTIDSRVNYQKRFSWGTLSLGGSRTQSLDNPRVTASLPSLSFTPNPIRVTSFLTWSPSFSFANAIQQHSGSKAALFLAPGVVDSVLTDSRSSQLTVSSPLRIGRWDISNSFSVTDSWSSQRDTVRLPVPGDTTRRSLRTYGESYQTTVDWSVGLGLPILLQGTWNLAPSVQMANRAGSAYYIRNRYTNGAFLSQGKRFLFALSASPTFFGRFPGFGPIARIRHSLSPSISFAYAPASDIPLDYAIAANNGRVPTTLRAPAQQSVSFGLSQNFEAKLRAPRRAAGDTTTATGEPPEGRKIMLLSIQSGGIGYDFEQARQPGRTGWTTGTWGNTIRSDLLHGFSLSITHDLWKGPVGYDSSRFSPFLTSVTTGFSLGAGSFDFLRRLFGLAAAPPRRDTAVTDTLTQPTSPTNPGGRLNNAFQQGPLATQYGSVDRMSPSRGGGSFQAQLNFSLQRTRPIPNQAPQPTSSMVSGNVSFSPTRHWTVSWATSYNFTDGTFSQHVLRLDRDLHDWRATFTFVRSPNGNFAFNFFIALIAEPDLKFTYDQRNVR